QDVQAALTRLADAKKWAASYELEVMPNLQKARGEVEKLFVNNDPSIDLIRLLAMTRSYLKATETLVDARYEVSQAQADLALAVAEPSLALGQPTPTAANPPPANSVNSPLRPGVRALLGQPTELPPVRKN